MAATGCEGGVGGIGRVRRGRVVGCGGFLGRGEAHARGWTLRYGMAMRGRKPWKG